MPGTKAKKVRARLNRRIYSDRLTKPLEALSPPSSGMIIMIVVSVLIATLVLKWASGIKPPVLESSASVSVVSIDPNTSAVTILSIEPKNAAIKYLTYNSSRGSGIINSMLNESLPARDVGDSGLIPVPRGVDVEIVAVFNDSAQKALYHGRV